MNVGFANVDRLPLKGFRFPLSPPPPPPRPPARVTAGLVEFVK